MTLKVVFINGEPKLVKHTCANNYNRKCEAVIKYAHQYINQQTEQRYNYFELTRYKSFDSSYIKTTVEKLK